MTRNLAIVPNEPPAEDREREQECRNHEVDARILSARQTNEAINELCDSRLPLRFPYPDLDAIAHAIGPKRLVIIAAHTGHGKTTFALDLMDRWAEAGTRIDFLGTEQEPLELRLKWASLRLGIPASLAINREWDAHPDGEAMRERLVEELAKIDEAYGDRVLLVPDKFIDLAKIEEAAQRAYERRSQLLIIDHIDRVDTGARGDSEYLELKRILRRLKELARDCGLIVIAFSQINRKAREGDRLRVYRMPELQFLQGGSAKEQEADLVLFLFKMIRQRYPNETAEEFSAVLRAARNGELEPRDFVEQDIMGVGCGKHRTVGPSEGKRCRLRIEHGRISHIPERDRYVTSPTVRGPRP